VAHDVADRDRHPAADEREHVVPVAPQAGAGGGEVARRALEPGAVGDLRGEQPLLDRLRHPPLRVQARLLDGERGAVAGQLEQVALVAVEDARGEAADVQDADDAALDEERDAEQAT
jgi:hypothetical protein